MTTPQRGLLFHFTHVDNLASVASTGLRSDNDVATSRTSFVEVAHRHIKDRRQEQAVPLAPGGVVADYVPFYFAARSPMLYAIHKGGVSTYANGQSEIVYLVTSVDTIVQAPLPFVFTDRNASLTFAHFGNDVTDIDRFVDWELMDSRWFSDTPQKPDRKERRMAEFLVHGTVPWAAFVGIAAQSPAMSRQPSLCADQARGASSRGLRRQKPTSGRGGTHHRASWCSR